MIPNNRAGLKHSRYLLVPILLAAVLIVPGCEEPRRVERAPMRIRLVHEPELSSFLRERLRAFEVREQPTVLEHSTQLELVPERGASAARRIARGELKVHAWISSSSSLIEHANSHLKNLGPEQKECTPLFASPVVFAGAANLLETESGTSVPWTQIRRRLGAEFKPLRLVHGTPGSSTTGLAAILQLSALEGGVGIGGAPLEVAAISKALEHIERSAAAYGTNESLMLAIAQEQRVPGALAVTTEHEAISFNRGREADQRLRLWYPAEGSYWQDYTLCISQADWVTPIHRTFLRELVTFLTSPASQLAVKEDGWRPARSDLPSVVEMTPELGVDPAQPAQSQSPISAEGLQTVLDLWPQIRRQSMLIAAIDTSGSMEGLALSATREVLRNAFARRTSLRDLSALQAFGPQARIEVAPTNIHTQAINALDRIDIRGGSAVWDGIASVFEMALKRDYSQYLVSAVVVTDGFDKLSTRTVEEVLQLAKNVAESGRIKLTIVAVQTEGDPFTDLRKIATVAGGRFVETSVEKIPEVLGEALVE